MFRFDNIDLRVVVIFLILGRIKSVNGEAVIELSFYLQLFQNFLKFGSLSGLLSNLSVLQCREF